VTRAAVYVRVSTDDQAREGYSLADQERRGREVAEREGWDVTVYREPARSGADRERPELTRLLRDLEAGEIDVVWFDSQDRLARDVGHTADLFARFLLADVAVWERWQKIDLGEDGQAQVDLKALFAAWERRKIKARTKKGIAARSHTGKQWGAVPFGYRKDDDGKLEPDPEQVPVIRRVFATYMATGGSYNGTAASLTRAGVPPPKGGGMWGSSSVRNIIAREHPAVDADTWQTAQTLAGQSKRWTPKGGGRLPANHLFVRGSLRCSWCESAMIPRTDTKTGRETY
jgi:site-specific DNA recombinase